VVDSSNPRPIRVAGLTTWRGTMDAAPICWMNGPQDDGAVDAHAFAPQYRDLGFGEQVTLGSDGRSSERFVPIAAVDGGAGALVDAAVPDSTRRRGTAGLSEVGQHVVGGMQRAGARSWTV